MNNSIWPKRLFALDLSRGIAALAVVVWHWQHFAYHGISLPKDFDRASQPLYSIFKIFYEKGAIGVDYFFLLSGFIFFWLYRSSIEDGTTSFRNFWVQRISRLYPLHLATLLIVAFLQMVYVAYNRMPFVYFYNDTYHFLLNLIFASRWGFEKGFSFNSPTWSVSIEILLYFMFFLAAYTGRGRGLFCLAVSILTFFLALFIPSAIVILQAASLFFLGGFIFYFTLLISMGSQKLKIVICLITAGFWILTLVDFYIYDFSNLILELGVFGSVFLLAFPYYVLFPSTLCSLVLIEIDRGPGFLKSIPWVGDISYSSYLLHFPLQLVVALAVTFGVLKFDFYLNPVSLVLFFFILIPLSYITFIYFERPIQNAIRNKYLRRASSLSSTL